MVRKTEPDRRSSACQREIASRWFPLVPRPKPVCRSLEERINRVQNQAQLASQQTPDSLVRAAEAHNLAALIASDCGLPDLARDLCRRQFTVFLNAGPYDVDIAKLALQPLINLGRLHIRDGNGNAAYQLFRGLFDAVASRAATVVDEQHLDVADLVHAGDDHRQLLQWMWSIVLNDGTRALTRAGRWAEAYEHARHHKGIGERLLDGRQVAILAQCAAGNHEAALATLRAIASSAPWEETVAACLRVLCLQAAERPTEAAIHTMVERYLDLSVPNDGAVFQTRLGLCITDLTAGGYRLKEVTKRLMQAVVESADAYAAYEVLTHPTCGVQMKPDDIGALSVTVQAAGFGRQAITPSLLGQLAESVRASEAAMRTALGKQGMR
jgi:hypothetical protein